MECAATDEQVLYCGHAKVTFLHCKSVVCLMEWR